MNFQEPCCQPQKHQPELLYASGSPHWILNPALMDLVAFEWLGNASFGALPCRPRLPGKSRPCIPNPHIFCPKSDAWSKSKKNRHASKSPHCLPQVRCMVQIQKESPCVQISTLFAPSQMHGPNPKRIAMCPNPHILCSKSDAWSKSKKNRNASTFFAPSPHIFCPKSDAWSKSKKSRHASKSPHFCPKSDAWSKSKKNRNRPNPTFFGPKSDVWFDFFLRYKRIFREKDHQIPTFWPKSDLSEV